MRSGYSALLVSGPHWLFSFAAAAGLFLQVRHYPRPGVIISSRPRCQPLGWSVSPVPPRTHCSKSAVRDLLRIAWRPAVVCDVCTLERGPLTADTVGLRLAEANDLLAAVQQTLVAEQARATVAAQARCPHCGTPHRRKDSRDIVMRTLRQVVQADRHRRVLRAVGRLGDRQGAFQQRPGRRRLPSGSAPPAPGLSGRSAGGRVRGIGTYRTPLRSPRRAGGAYDLIDAGAPR